MNIALVVPGGVDRSGRERVVPALLSLIRRLASRHRVHVFALRQYDAPCRYPLLGATVSNLGRPPRLRAMPGRTLAWHYRALADGLRSEGAFDVVHAFWADTPGWLATALGRRLDIPVVVSLAGGELVALPEIAYGGQRRWGSRVRVARTLRRAQVVTVASAFLGALAAAHGVRVREIALGAEPEVPPADVRGARGAPFRLLHVASLNRVKDQPTLLAALQRVVRAEPGVQLDVVGEDTRAGAVQRRCAALGLEAHVTFHGFLPSDAVRALYRRADLFVLTSRHEAGPVVVLEAAMHGVPTVGTAVGHLADWAGSERARVVPVGDDRALADAILHLLRDDAERAAVGRSARAWALAHDADWTADRFEALYREVLERRTPAADPGGRGGRPARSRASR